MAKNIKETFASQLASGKVIVTDIIEAQNGNGKRIEVAQLGKATTPNLISIFQGTTSRPVLVAWMPITDEQFKASNFKGKGEVLENAISKEMKEGLMGHALNIQVNESTTPFTWKAKGSDVININKRAKRKGGENGEFLLKDGDYIFRQTLLVPGEPNNTSVQHDNTTTEAPDYDFLEAALQAESGVSIAN